MTAKVAPATPWDNARMLAAGVVYRQAIAKADFAFAREVDSFRERLRGRDWPHHVIAGISFRGQRVNCACGWYMGSDDALAAAFASHRRVTPDLASPPFEAEQTDE